MIYGVVNVGGAIAFANAGVISNFLGQDGFNIVKDETMGADESLDTEYVKSNFTSVKDLKANGEALTQKVMEEGAKQMFKYAFVKLSPMKFPVAEQLIAAQLITDRVISNATPAANNDPNFGKYAKCFAMKCSDEFIKQVLDDTAYETQSELYMANKTQDIAIAREGLGIDLQVELEMDINEHENAPIQDEIEDPGEIKDKVNIIS
jgi:hypothetical protein